jgi:N-acetylglucosamine malate deacetylase 1
MKGTFKRFILWAWHIVVPKRARNSLRLWLMLDIPDLAPRMIEQFDEGAVVVLAPHMDDEIIGPGGTVARHVQSGSAVTSVFMTKDADAQTRIAESRAAAEIVGVRDLVFLDGPDGALDDSEEMVGRLSKILEERKPRIVYVPGMTDYHRDHWATNRILRKALDRLKGDILIRGYEVWTPLPANRMVDISSTVEIKRKAIAVFVSQTRLVDYARTILGLNQYRSMMHLHGQGFAEAFLENTAEEYRRLFDAISVKRPCGQR